MNFNKNGEVSRFAAFTAAVIFMALSLVCLITGGSEKLLPGIIIAGFSATISAADLILKKIQQLLDR